MIKIALYEDSINDVKKHYASLTSKYDVNLYFSGDLSKFLDDFLDDFVEMGFKKDQIHKGIPSTPITADFHFVDGLSGKCSGLLKVLPKENTYLISGDPDLRDEAQNLGYKAIDKGMPFDNKLSIENIINGDM